ncbi:MAG: phosphatase PAP2 family protein [Terriglobia bacterium]
MFWNFSFDFVVVSVITSHREKKLFSRRVFGTLVLLAAILSCSLKGQNPKSSHCSSASAADFQSTPSSSQSAFGYDRPVSWKSIVPNILCDQKAIWLFPTEVGTHRNWIPTLSIAGATAGLFMLDPSEGKYFHQTSTFQEFNEAFTSKATVMATIVAPVSLYAAGLLRKDPKMQNTALLTGEAVVDAEIVTTVLKDIDRRARPVTFTPHGNYWDSWFEDRGSPLRGDGSFPSGHTIAAFAIATVIAHRYRTHRWVPYVCYGMASLVGFSRMSLSAHFASDVFVGAALGYSISRFAVLRY